MPPAFEERALLVGLELKKAPRQGAACGTRSPADRAEESLEELGVLAESAGAVVVDRLIQVRESPEAATLIGAGKVGELAALAGGTRCELVLFDRDLSPTQLRNLERALPCKVLDRTQLILDIFARRARTREGQLQVELAQLNYLLPRLTGRGVAMSRLGGGIGTRGPGETQLETDRRRIYRRIRKIQEQLEQVRASRSIQRRQRQAVPLATVALVGYTNAGKSTLFNALTGAGVLADAKMFATLDPTVRYLRLPSRRRALVADTVGFIRHLPSALVKAFRATLEEVTEASLLLHIVDASSPHAGEMTQHVTEVLLEIGAARTPQLLVLNKADLLGGESPDVDVLRRRIVQEFQTPEVARAVAISALREQGLGALLEAVDAMLPLDPVVRATFRIPLADAGRVHWLHEFGRVEWTDYQPEACVVEAEVPQSLCDSLREYLV